MCSKKNQGQAVAVFQIKPTRLPEEKPLKLTMRKPRRRFRELLKSQAMQRDQQDVSDQAHAALTTNSLLIGLEIVTFPPFVTLYNRVITLIVSARHFYCLHSYPTIAKL
jgi:hypothetical protein